MNDDQARYVIRGPLGFYAGPTVPHPLNGPASPPRWLPRPSPFWLFGSEKAARERIEDRAWTEAEAWPEVCVVVVTDRDLDEDDRLLRIYITFDQHMRDGRFDLCDRLLRSYIELVDLVAVVELLAVLSITTPAREHLVARKGFAHLVRKRLERDDPERAEDLLRGLE